MPRARGTALLRIRLASGPLSARRRLAGRPRAARAVPARDERPRGPKGLEGPARVRDPDAPLVGGPRVHGPGPHHDGRVDARARLHVAAPSLAHGVRVPRRLRHEPRPAPPRGRASTTTPRACPARTTTRTRRTSSRGRKATAASSPSSRRAPRDASRPPPSSSTSCRRRRRGAPVALRVLDAARNEVVAVEAAHAILALPKFVAARVLAPWRAAPPAFLKETSWAPWLVANLTLRARPKETGFPLAWDNVLHDSRSLGYVVATHQTGPEHGPTVFTYYLPFTDEAPAAARAKLLAASWDDLASAVLADLSTAHRDLPDLVTRLDVVRWGHAMARPTPGFLSSPVRHLAPVGGVHFAHADSGGASAFRGGAGRRRASRRGGPRLARRARSRPMAAG